MNKDELIKAYNLTEQELGQLRFMYGNVWMEHPAMYIGTMRRSNKRYQCSECGREISYHDHDDYDGLCERCYRMWH